MHGKFPTPPCVAIMTFERARNPTDNLNNHTTQAGKVFSLVEMALTEHLSTRLHDWIPTAWRINSAIHRISSPF